VAARLLRAPKPAWFTPAAAAAHRLLRASPHHLGWRPAAGPIFQHFFSLSTRGGNPLEAAGGAGGSLPCSRRWNHLPAGVEGMSRFASSPLPVFPWWLPWPPTPQIAHRGPSIGPGQLASPWRWRTSSANRPPSHEPRTHGLLFSFRAGRALPSVCAALSLGARGPPTNRPIESGLRTASADHARSRCRPHRQAHHWSTCPTKPVC